MRASLYRCGQRVAQGRDAMTQPIYKKNKDQSASKIGQFVHDHQPMQHDGIDIDYVAWKSARNCLRIIEEKLPGEDVRPSQKRMLPLLAKLIELGKEAGLLADDSGVFVLHWWQHPDAPVVDDEGRLCATFKIRRVSDAGIGVAEDISPDAVCDLVCGMEVSTRKDGTDGI